MGVHLWVFLGICAGTTSSALGGFRQGLLSGLANPKIAAFFTSVLPQLAGSGQSVLVPFLAMGRPALERR